MSVGVLKERWIIHPFFLLFKGQGIKMFTLQEEDFGLQDSKVARTKSEGIKNGLGTKQRRNRLK